MSRLERWSRIKRNVAREEDSPPPASKAPVEETSLELTSSEAVSTSSETVQAHVTTDAGHEKAPTSPEPEPGSLDHTLPDPETLEAGSDFSAFMAPGVSGPLRRQALKRLWATGNYNVRDGLDDYDADYNQLLKPMTSELAGKLRRWTHKVEEAVDKSLAEAESELPVEEETLTPDAESGASEKNIALDDQSDYLSGPKTKT